MKKINLDRARPQDADKLQAVEPVICYNPSTLENYDFTIYEAVRHTMKKINSELIPPRSASCINVNAGQFFRIKSVDGPQVGDLNLWSREELSEFFYSGKTRALYGTHVSTKDRLWSSLPTMRPMATITHDTLDWYGFDSFGGSVHDIIGTRCDPYTNNLISGGGQYHYCCHSNLTRALAKHCDLKLNIAEKYVHDVLNVFMCTGFTRDTGQYFMKESPVKPGDYLEFFAEIDLIVGLSACPGGNCASEHSSDQANCYPLEIEVFSVDPNKLIGWQKATINQYDRSHGLSEK
ncbi:DUF1989 domain-containing protein [Paracoccaceae bacterium]|jgi:uncharacterized protein YcgI (DUF1989 family)|nr:DUF1989 domain-containing protein [Paracoccaceae bacterium]MDA9123374.1 DUF1989 domain-containing protein [Paracoccaceae bacterium]MDE2693927.1 DUF1989 domain-containing protein [Paracoccaceae bacterium]|tara:strand:+ start:38 stop:913 length:876 start_codon:yes stop_codon:yes gene_type:complete